MKKWIGIIAIVAAVTFELVDSVRDFNGNDTIHYFAKQPSRLLLIASIGIAGGIIAVILEKLRPRVTYCVWGLALSILTMSGIYMSYEFISVARQFGPLNSWQIVTLLPLSLGIMICLLWLEFYFDIKKRRKSRIGL
jgi:hypothetical protein